VMPTAGMQTIASAVALLLHTMMKVITMAEGATVKPQRFVK